MCHHAYLLDGKIAWYDPCGMRFCRRDRVLKYDWLLVPRVLKTICKKYVDGDEMKQRLWKCVMCR